MTFDVTKAYSREDFEDFIRDFLPDDFEPAEEELYAGSQNIEQWLRLGSCQSLDLDVLEFRTKKDGDPRVTLTREVCGLMKKHSTNPNALAVFYCDESQSWRFSLITTDYKLENGKIKTEYSNPRRFSFLLGKGCKRHTPEEMLIAKGQIRERTENGKKLTPFEDLKSRFDIEVVTKEFYNELFSWYEWACSLAKFPDGRGGNVKLTDKNNEQSLIRLVTRLIFVWFIKQKDLVPEWIFDENELKNVLSEFDSQSEAKGNYYNAVLQNLFFATLNKKIEERKFTDDNEAFKHYGIKTLYRDDKKKSFFKISHREVVEKFKSVPFLNGGLFECLDRLEEGEGGKNEQVYADGFSREEKRRAFLPNALFFQKQIPNQVLNDVPVLGDDSAHEGIVHILSRYNFTVEENSPSDVQVALDPELLGKVFENLLGTYNPETSETARKDSGSFYTPREIVHFMVNESLISYLSSQMTDNRTQFVIARSEATKQSLDEKIRTFVETENACEFSAEEKKQIITLLENIKVLDPACGSGAFPVGMLQKLVSLISHSEEQSKTESVSLSDLTRQSSDYNLKLHLIENCLYGVDIQTIAVQICKLRFFITLICEQEKTDDASKNYGFNPLPNLETKFVAADSLVSLAKNASEDMTLFTNPEIGKTKEALQETRRKHFSAPNAAMKRKYRDDDKKLREKLAKLLAEDKICDNKEAKQLAAWNPYDQNAVSDFFDAEWMFGISVDSQQKSDNRKLSTVNCKLNSGFDIVIGNPPYIQLQKNGGELAKKYEGENSKSYAKTGDIYCLFYERGFNLLKKGGHLCFITSNKWMRAGYGEKLREFLSKNTNPLLLIDFAGVKIFESATVDTNILLFEKGANKKATTACVTKNLTEDGLKNLSGFIQQNSSEIAFNTSDSWVVLSPIEQSIKRKIESVGTPLKDWDIQIYRGILTGYNDAFIITTEKRNEILSNCKTQDERKRTEELIRPILRGRDIKRYGYDWAGLWLVNTHNGVKEKNIPRIDIKDYPAVKKHLDQYWDKIKDRSDQGDTPYNLRNCAYLEDFGKPKVMYPNMTSKMPFYYDERGFFQNDKSFMITGKNIAFLTAFFNSSLFKYCFTDNFPSLGEKGRELRKIFFDKIPVIQIDGKTENQFEKLVTDIQSDYTEEKARKIDSVIFDLYNLTKEEREMIGFIEIK